MHDTLRCDTRVYGEDIFYGRGKEKDQWEENWVFAWNLDRLIM